MPAMSDLSSVVLNTRLWAIACLGALGLTLLLSLFGHLVGPRIWGATPEDTRAAGQVMLPVFFCLFLVIGFSALPLMTNLAVSGLERMWTAMGLMERPLNAKVMALLHQHQVHFVVVVWGLFVVGLILAAPHMIRDWSEASPPSAAGGRGAARARPAGSDVLQRAGLDRENAVRAAAAGAGRNDNLSRLRGASRSHDFQDTHAGGIAADRYLAAKQQINKLAVSS